MERRDSKADASAWLDSQALYVAWLKSNFSKLTKAFLTSKEFINIYSGLYTSGNFKNFIPTGKILTTEDEVHDVVMENFSKSRTYSAALYDFGHKQFLNQKPSASAAPASTAPASTGPKPIEKPLETVKKLKCGAAASAKPDESVSSLAFNFSGVDNDSQNTGCVLPSSSHSC